ncbi:hypothetical protein [Streptomyces sp. NPDC002122]|uniref:protein kinase domain-containing protein n=1 Tax=Streptomyces sp. NPDC002122 TaxID=3154407 RepID=UPI003319566B
MLCDAAGPKAIDFGIARAFDGTVLTAAGMAVGTLGFMSPEQLDGTGFVGPASDVFSLGVLLCWAGVRELIGAYEAKTREVVASAPLVPAVPSAAVPVPAPPDGPPRRSRTRVRVAVTAVAAVLAVTSAAGRSATAPRPGRRPRPSACRRSARNSIRIAMFECAPMA